MVAKVLVLRYTMLSKDGALRLLCADTVEGETGYTCRSCDSANFINK
jgi:hypothetical protein